MEMQHNNPFSIYIADFKHTTVTLPKDTTLGLVLPSPRAILHPDEGMQNDNAVVDTEDFPRSDNELY